MLVTANLVYPQFLLMVVCIYGLKIQWDQDNKRLIQFISVLFVVALWTCTTMMELYVKSPFLEMKLQQMSENGIARLAQVRDPLINFHDQSFRIDAHESI